MATQPVDSASPAQNDGGTMFGASSAPATSRFTNQVLLGEKQAQMDSLFEGAASANRGHSFITGVGLVEVTDYTKLIDITIGDQIIDRPNSKMTDSYQGIANPLLNGGASVADSNWVNVLNTTDGSTSGINLSDNVSTEYGISQSVDNSIYNAVVTFKGGGTMASGLKYQ